MNGRKTAGLALVALALTVGAQTPEELVAQLKNPVAAERSKALVAIAKLKKPEASLLDQVAPSLLDDSEEVQTAAAYSIAAIAGRVGCKIDALDECEVLRTIFDSTPKATTRVPLRYPVEARNGGVQGSVRVEFLIRSDGSIDKLRVLDGPPQLRDAATSSLKQWRYLPARRNGTPVPFVMVFRASFSRS